MILNGNDRVGEAKVYKTSLEMKQAKEIESLKKELESAREVIEVNHKILSNKDGWLNKNVQPVMLALRFWLNQNKKQGE